MSTKTDTPCYVGVHLPAGGFVYEAATIRDAEHDAAVDERMRRLLGEDAQARERASYRVDFGSPGIGYMGTKVTVDFVRTQDDLYVCVSDALPDPVYDRPVLRSVYTNKTARDKGCPLIYESGSEAPVALFVAQALAECSPMFAAGFLNALDVMGAYLEAQLRVVGEKRGRVWYPDPNGLQGDDAGTVKTEGKGPARW